MGVRRPFLSCFLALLIAVRLASPIGFMPGESGGRLALVECPDAISIPSGDEAHHGMDHGDGAKAKPTCPFAAGMAPAGPLPELTALHAAVGRPLETISFPPRASLAASARIAPRPPSRAPPQG